MCTNDESFDILSYRFKSARRKKRLLKKDIEKKLIHLDNRVWKLTIERRELPLIPLEKPYQSGWKRSFVLSEELRQSGEATFYQELLDKINTVQYSKDKKFMIKKWRKQKKVHGVAPQLLKQYSPRDWKIFKLKLTEKERELFYAKETWSAKGTVSTVNYVFREPWRFVLQVQPNIITEIKMIDPVLESEYQCLRDHIATNNLEHKIIKLARGDAYRYVDYEFRALKQGMSPNKQSLHKLLDDLH